jgi:hypothetical protein
MAIGQKMTIKIHENESGVIVFDSVSIVPFTHDAGFSGYSGVPGVGPSTVVRKEDFTGSANDSFVVQITGLWNSFSPSLTIAQITTMAVDAVNAVFGNGEAGAPS